LAFFPRRGNLVGRTRDVKELEFLCELSNGYKFISIADCAIYGGRGFVVHTTGTIPAGDTQNLLFVGTEEGRNAFLSSREFRISGGEIDIRFLEGATYTDPGTLIDTFNVNRVRPLIDPFMLAYEDVQGVDATNAAILEQFTFYHPAGVRIPQLHASAIAWIIDDKPYIFEMVNNTNDPIDFGFTGFWYELEVALGV